MGKQLELGLPSGRLAPNRLCEECGVNGRWFRLCDSEARTWRRDASFSDDRVYRFSLYRERCVHARKLGIVMLNPSIADENCNDPTTTRMLRFCERNRFGRYRAVNLWPFVSSNPKALRDHEFSERVMDWQDAEIRAIARWADLVLVAWGRHGCRDDRDRMVLDMLVGCTLWCFGYNADGTPRFPLYVRRDVTLREFTGRPRDDGQR